MDTNNLKVLIADDSAFMRKILKDILATMHLTDVIEAENGKEAIEKFNSEKPELVLLDIIMPEADGIEVIKNIGKKVNVLIISAIGQDKLIKEAKDLGAKGYIVKPFDRNQVVEEIQKVAGV